MVLSASHNPYQDNGIKFFGGDGYKLSDADRGRDRGRARAAAASSRSTRVASCSSTARSRTTCARSQERFSGLDLTGRRILIDCANGATFRAAPEIFRRLGADIGVIAHEPDGRNINLNSGSTHLERLQAAMQAGDDEIGFAFDGDGDRMLAVDRNGAVVDGDELIALAAIHLRDTGRLPGNGVAVTVMTNYGFHTAMAEHGIEVAITSVGDRYVLEALREREWALGGEQSGHIIDRNFVPSGDGIASALLTLEALGTTNLADRSGDGEAAADAGQRARARPRARSSSATDVHEAVERESAALEGRGRVLLRPSGTEPLVRVMVEAPTADEAEAVCARLVAASKPPRLYEFFAEVGARPARCLDSRVRRRSTSTLRRARQRVRAGRLRERVGGTVPAARHCARC